MLMAVWGTKNQIDIDWFESGQRLSLWWVTKKGRLQDYFIYEKKLEKMVDFRQLWKLIIDLHTYV